MLQDQFNKEYDLMLKRTEEKFNRDSKGIFNLYKFLILYFQCFDFFYFTVNISYTNYRTSLCDDQDDKDTDIEDTTKDFDRFVVNIF